jgi:hypothetical protein
MVESTEDEDQEAIDMPYERVQVAVFQQNQTKGSKECDPGFALAFLF